jgi:O-antigen/teichoic acid export membrane protein
MNKASLSKSVAWYGLGNIFVRALSFLLLPLYSNLLSTSSFGDYSLLMSVYAVALVIYQFGMFGALNKFFIEEKSEQKKKLIFSSILNSIFIISILVTGILWASSSEISKLVFGTSEFSKLLVLLLFSILFETLCSYIFYLLKTMELAKKAVTYSAAGAILNLLLNIIFVYYLKLGVPGIIYAQLISGFILFVLLFNLMKANYVFRIDKVILKTVLRFSIPLIFANLLTAGNNVADRFILNILSGKEVVGIYSFSYRIAMIMNIFVVSFTSAWSPHSLNLYYANDYKETFGKTLNKLVALSCLLLLVVSLFVPYLFDFYLFGFTFFNSSYKAGIIIIPLVMTGYIFNGISSFYSVYPSVSNKTYHILISDLGAFIINVGLNILLIPKLGMLGAAFATLTGFVFAAAYLFVVSKKVIVIDYKTKELMIIILIALIFLFIGLNLSSFIISLLLVLIYLTALNYLTDFKVMQLFKLS